MFLISYVKELLLDIIFHDIYLNLTNDNSLLIVRLNEVSQKSEGYFFFLLHALYDYILY